MHIVTIWYFLLEMSNLVFWENKNKYFNMASAENFTQSAILSINDRKL